MSLWVFNVSNGIRQGGIISPLLCTDILLRNLTDSDIGSYIGHMYVGAMAFAGDLKLWCPTISRLKQVVSVWVCSEFGVEYDI